MNHHVTHDPTDRALLQCLPFSGLGFDLTPVAERAALMLLGPLVEPQARVKRQDMEAPVSGYLLQLLLGREVRAG